MNAARTGALLIPSAREIAVSERCSPSSRPPETMASRMRSNASRVIDMGRCPPHASYVWGLEPLCSQPLHLAAFLESTPAFVVVELVDLDVLLARIGIVGGVDRRGRADVVD